MGPNCLLHKAPSTRISGGPWPARVNAIVVPSAERTVSMVSSVWGWVRASSGEGPAEPGGPGVLGPLGIHRGGEQLVSRHDGLAEAAQEPVERILRPNADGVGVREVDDAVHGPDVIGGEPDQVAAGR